MVQNLQDKLQNMQHYALNTFFQSLLDSSFMQGVPSDDILQESGCKGFYTDLIQTGSLKYDESNVVGKDCFRCSLNYSRRKGLLFSHPLYTPYLLLRHMYNSAEIL